MESLDDHLLRYLAECLGGRLCARNLSACCRRFRGAIGRPPTLYELAGERQELRGNSRLIEELVRIGDMRSFEVRQMGAWHLIREYVDWASTHLSREGFRRVVLFGRRREDESAEVTRTVLCKSTDSFVFGRKSEGRTDPMMQWLCEDRPILLRYILPKLYDFVYFATHVLRYCSDESIDSFARAWSTVVGRKRMRRYMRGCHHFMLENPGSAACVCRPWARINVAALLLPHNITAANSSVFYANQFYYSK